MNVNKFISKIVLVALLVAPVAAMLPGVANAATPPAWNVSGNYVVNQTYNGTNNTVNVTLSQDSSGNVTGSGSNSPYTWTIVSGSVSGNTLRYTADYTATADAVTPLTVMTVTDTINPDGSMTGTWTDNYQNANPLRTGTWDTTSGNAVAYSNDDMVTSTTYTVGALNAGAGTITNVPFGTPKATFESNLTKDQANQTWNDSSVNDPVQSGDTLVVTAQDGVTMATYTVTVNAAPSNNPTTLAATNITTSDATLNATNGAGAATQESFWVSLSPIDTSSSNIPAGVYSTPALLTGVSANAAFSDALSIVSTQGITTGGVPGNLTITPNTTYNYVAWVNVGGQWYPGGPETVTTAALSNNATVTGIYTISPLSGTNTGTGTITDVAPGITVANFSAGLTPATGATFKVTESDGVTAATDPVVDGDEVVVTAQDGTTMGTYTITVSVAGSGLSGTVGEGVLKLDSIVPVKTTAIADGTFANGWSYTFNLTIPTNETNVAMKFNNWTGSNPLNTIPVANNMQISSAQATNGVITLSAANTYSSTLTINPALGTPDPLGGIDIAVTVNVAIPVGTPADSYTTNYGIQTTP